VYALERHQKILGRARSEGRVEVKQLADDLDVTPETVRRDLTALERLGVLRLASRRGGSRGASRDRARGG